MTPQIKQSATFPRRLLIAATDTGQMLRGQLEDLQKLVSAYHQSILVETARAVPARSGRMLRSHSHSLNISSPSGFIPDGGHLCRQAVAPFIIARGFAHEQSSFYRFLIDIRRILNRTGCTFLFS
ncbi:MAG TPA: hypothetical protein VGD69_12285 [Herpetosiphonaceae bacterium]